MSQTGKVTNVQASIAGSYANDKEIREFDIEKNSTIHGKQLPLFKEVVGSDPSLSSTDDGHNCASDDFQNPDEDQDKEQNNSNVIKFPKTKKENVTSSETSKYYSIDLAKFCRKSEKTFLKKYGHNVYSQPVKKITKNETALLDTTTDEYVKNKINNG